jgi:hypothetical protein
MKKTIIGILALSSIFKVADAQRAALPSVPFMTISPDARSAAMGDAGVGSQNYDANALYWNSSKLVFADKTVGGSISVTPWLRNITDDMAVIGLSGFKKTDKNLVLGAMLGYFNSGSIQFTTPFGQPISTFDSREFYLSGSVARRLSTNLSAGVNLKFINSNLTGNNAINNVSYSPGRAVAGDLNVFYANDLRKRDAAKGSEVSWGLSIMNLGNKISYGTGKANFIPTTFKLGGGLKYHLDDRNQLSFIADINKLMIPSEPVRDAQGNILRGEDPGTKTPLSALVTSFGDSPDGFSGEMREFYLSGGAEYWYNEVFALRAGYFFQPTYAGSLRYFTTGLGARVQEKFGVDFAYLIPSAGNNSPLANTLRISLVYDVPKKKRKSSTPATTESEMLKNGAGNNE